MSMTKKLGGDRLGSGNKMNVHLKGYERSTHDIGYIWRSSMSSGTLVPFMVEVGLPGDTFDIDLNVDVKTLPTLGPLFGSYKVQLDVFTAPIRLYNNKMHNNMLNIGMDMSQVTLPIMEFTVQGISDTPEDLDNSQINPSCILAYLGLRGYGINVDTAVNRSFNGVPLLAYWEIYKNYYANKQEGIGAVIHKDAQEINTTVDQIENSTQGLVIDQYPTVSVNGGFNYGDTIFVGYTGAPPVPDTVLMYVNGWGWLNLFQLSLNGVTDNGAGLSFEWNGVYNGVVQYWNYENNMTPVTNLPKITTFNLSNIDDMRTEILRGDSDPFDIFGTGYYPYKYLEQQPNGVYNTLSSQEGLGLKTYQSDVFNNWLETSWISQISTTSAVSTVGNSFTIDQLILSKKVYEMLNRIAVSGGSYDDWIEAVYDHKSYNRAESPVYHGGLIKELVFQEVVSNTGVEGSPLGTLAGKGVMAKKHKGGKVQIKCNEHCYVMGIVSLTPRIDYSQGNRWDVHLTTMDDFHKPQMDEIGFQDLITEQMAWWDTQHNGVTWVQKSAGKQPAWVNYMTNYSRTYGNFAMKDKEMFMTLNRRYEEESYSIKDLTTYIDPSKFNFIFAETALDSQNFWVQIGNDITVRRKMSAKIMPNL